MVKKRTSNIVAWDTSGHALVLAHRFQGKSVFHREANFVTHSEELFTNLRRVMSVKNSSSYDAVGIGLGPGSFTGIRVGVTAAKTLAYAWNLPLIAISTLEIIAANCPPESRPICVTLDARRNNLYTAKYHQGVCIQKPQLWSVSDFIFKLQEDCLYTGDGIEKIKSVLTKKCGKKSFVQDKRKWYPKPQKLLDLVQERLEQKKFESVLTLEPQYLYDDKCNVTQSKISNS